MATVEVEVHDTVVLASLRKAAQRQRYAIANAINTTLLAVQRSVPESMRRHGFVVRNKAFMFGGGGRTGGAANKITDFAKPTPGKQWGRIAVRTSEISSTRRLLLGQLEQGGERKPMTPGARAVAIPLLGRPARPSIAQPVVPAYRFSALKFQRYVGGKREVRRMRGRHKRGTGVFGEYGVADWGRMQQGGVQWKGAQRTFILPKSARAPLGGVFQRIGPGRSGVRMIYSFRRNPHLRAMLHFVDNAAAVTHQTFRIALFNEVQQTLKFHGFNPGGAK